MFRLRIGCAAFRALCSELCGVRQGIPQWIIGRQMIHFRKQGRQILGVLLWSAFLFRRLAVLCYRRFWF